MYPKCTVATSCGMVTELMVAHTHVAANSAISQEVQVFTKATR